MKLDDVIEARDQWTSTSIRSVSFRVWDGKLYRRDMHPAFYGGRQIKFTPVDHPVAAEWLRQA